MGTSNNSNFVIPSKAGVQYFQCVMDSCFRRNDIFRGSLIYFSIWAYKNQASKDMYTLLNSGMPYDKEDARKCNNKGGSHAGKKIKGFFRQPEH